METREQLGTGTLVKQVVEIRPRKINLTIQGSFSHCCPNKGKHMKKRVDGNAKGKVGEREFAALLRSFGFEARRGQQFCGGNGDEDVVHSVPGMYFEVKRREKLNVREAYDQCVRDAKLSGDVPAVIHRCNRSKWMISLSAEHFLSLMRVIGEFETDRGSDV